MRAFSEKKDRGSDPAGTIKMALVRQDFFGYITGTGFFRSLFHSLEARS